MTLNQVSELRLTCSLRGNYRDSLCSTIGWVYKFLRFGMVFSCIDSPPSRRCHLLRVNTFSVIFVSGIKLAEKDSHFGLIPLDSPSWTNTYNKYISLYYLSIQFYTCILLCRPFPRKLLCSCRDWGCILVGALRTNPQYIRLHKCIWACLRPRCKSLKWK